MTPTSLLHHAHTVLTTADALDKAATAHKVCADFQSGNLVWTGDKVSAPDRPARPARPLLISPGKMPKRRISTNPGRAALIHAVSHIELNAIDLAFDMLVRFAPTVFTLAGEQAGHEFVSDWLSVGDDEARHFGLLNKRLIEMGYSYGDFDAHDGLWDIAGRSADDVLARLALAPLVMEARGLDVTPGMIEKFQSVGDHENADALRIILTEEVRHVAIGSKWFKKIALLKGLSPVNHFHALVDQRFPGGLKPHFNHNAREAADFGREFYDGLVKSGI